MARRRSRTSATGGNMDSMLDTLTNVVGILVIVLVTVQLSSQEAASRIAATIAKIDPAEIERLEREAAEAKAAVEAAQKQIDAQREARGRDPKQQLVRLQAEANTAEAAASEAAARAAELLKRKTAEAAAAAEAARKAADAKAAAEKKVAELAQRRVALAAELDKTARPVAPPAKEVRLPDPRPAPDKAKELRVLCREGRIWVVEIEKLQEQAQKRAAAIVKQKKLDPDGDNWLTDGKVFADEFRKSPVRAAGFEMTVATPTQWPRLVLTRRPGSGQSADDAVKGTGELARVLRTYKPDSHYVRFHVWPDGFEAYLTARQFAGERGFAAGWEPVSTTDEHVISLGKYAIGTKPPPPPPGQKKPPTTPPPNVVD